ncbi:hypothetical protein [Streptomyces sp. NPDC088733]|uniref:hypothetical protein n=1 Tax=Streptomyces sp. NPDC088733 TaxID=3365880 RepID=UPI00382D4882
MTSKDEADGTGSGVSVRPPDGQELRAMVLERRWQQGRAWWYRVTVTLLARDDSHGVMRAVPSPVEFWASAASCSPLEGADYSHVPRWLVERRFQKPGEDGPLLLVHRGDCVSVRRSRQGVAAEEAWQSCSSPMPRRARCAGPSGP